MLISWLLKILSKLFFFTGMIKKKNAFDLTLSPEEEQKLFLKMKEGDNSAEELLIKHNLRLVAFIAKKYKNYNDQDELISVGSIGLMKAVKTYSLEKGRSFSTYASRCIENEILMLLRSQKKFSAEVSLNDSIGIDKDGNAISLIDVLSETGEDNVSKQVENKIIIEKIMQIINEKLTPKEADIMCMRYGLNGHIVKTQKEVAKIFGISRSYISRIEKQCISVIKNEIGKMV